jgi:rhodanese-related sulfurtransferase
VEFAAVHAAGARNVPLDRLTPADVLGSGPVYVICRSGSRGRQACARLAAAGGRDVANVAGGTLAWEQAGLPVVRGRPAVSLERQVRIAAGALVLLGTGLGAFVHPAFLAVAGFVGAGLVVSGVTDTCGMGLLLARMPWNRVAAPEAGPRCAA